MAGCPRSADADYVPVPPGSACQLGSCCCSVHMPAVPRYGICKAVSRPQHSSCVAARVPCYQARGRPVVPQEPAHSSRTACLEASCVPRGLCEKSQHASAGRSTHAAASAPRHTGTAAGGCTWPHPGWRSPTPGEAGLPQGLLLPAHLQEDHPTQLTAASHAISQPSKHA